MSGLPSLKSVLSGLFRLFSAFFALFLRQSLQNLGLTFWKCGMFLQLGMLRTPLFPPRAVAIITCLHELLSEILQETFEIQLSAESFLQSFREEWYPGFCIREGRTRQAAANRRIASHKATKVLSRPNRTMQCH